jgi:hypothetical protein
LSPDKKISKLSLLLISGDEFEEPPPHADKKNKHKIDTFFIEISIN